MKIHMTWQAIVLSSMIAGCGSLEKLAKTYQERMKRDKAGEKTPPIESIGNLDGRRTFVNCEEISNLQRWEKRSEDEAIADRRPLQFLPDRPSPWHLAKSGTDTDIVRTNEDTVFVLRPSDVVVVDRSSKKELGVIGFAADINAKLYLTKTQLILVSTASLPGPSVQYGSQIQFYNLNPGAMPSLASSMFVEGTVLDSRLLDHQLLLISNRAIHDGVDVAKETLGGLKCNQIIVPFKLGYFGPAFLPRSFDLLTIHTIDMLSPNHDVKKIGVLDFPNNIYISDNKVFLSQTVPPNITDDVTALTFLRQFDLESGRIGLSATGTLGGVVTDDSSFRLFGGKFLTVATTSRFRAGNSNRVDLQSAPTTANMVTTVAARGRDLVLEGTTESFAGGTEILSVKYVKNTAYVVTSQEKHPVYSVDLTNPKLPKLGENLSVLGISSKLYPVAGNILVGVDSDRGDRNIVPNGEGFQIHLFDSAEPLPHRSDVKSHGTFQSSSEASLDEHAMFIDATASLIGMPVLLYKATAPSNDIEYEFAGALFYNLSEGKLANERRKSHANFIPDDCSPHRLNMVWGREFVSNYDIRRILKIGSDIYTVSAFGIKIYDSNLSEPTGVIEFSDRENVCRQMLRWETPECGTVYPE
jgi:Beta propeller domain